MGFIVSSVDVPLVWVKSLKDFWWDVIFLILLSSYTSGEYLDTLSIYFSTFLHKTICELIRSKSLIHGIRGEIGKVEQIDLGSVIVSDERVLGIVFASETLRDLIVRTKLEVGGEGSTLECLELTTPKKASGAWVIDAHAPLPEHTEV